LQAKNHRSIKSKVSIYGISSTKHSHSGLDIFTQLEPIGACKKFAQQVETSIPILTTPPVTNAKTKILLKKQSDTKGIVLTYIPKTLGDPVQSLIEGLFYFRSGDNFTKAPYVIIKSLFAATESPDIIPIINEKVIELNPSGHWYIQIFIRNKSSAVAEKVNISVTIENPDSCDIVNSQYLKDVSNINPDKKVFTKYVNDVVHRGLDLQIGALMVIMKGNNRKINLEVKLFANKMRAHVFRFSVNLLKTKTTVTMLIDNYLY